MNTVEDLYLNRGQTETLWFSHENQQGLRGQAAMRNQGAKGDACRPLAAHEQETLLAYEGQGTIRSIWLTFYGYKQPGLRRSLRIKMYWDHSPNAAVDVPVGDFFCHPSCEAKKTFSNALFTNPEGRSFNCFIPMPFRKQARIVLHNTSDQAIPQIYYCIAMTTDNHQEDDPLYFHAVWHREEQTQLGRDFEILPQISGSGRFLGTHVQITSGDGYYDTWFGEGEIKVYLDGDRSYPSLAGTGTEDYIGTAWGQGEYSDPYFGCTLMDRQQERTQTAFYRFHIADPIWFKKDCRVTLQQIGSCGRDAMLKMLENNARIQVVYEIGTDLTYSRRLLESDPVSTAGASYSMPDDAYHFGFYRQDDVAATAYFYLDH